MSVNWLRTGIGTFFLAAILFQTAGASPPQSIQKRVTQYSTVRLSADLSGLSEQQRRMIPLLIEAAQYMDEIFWQQAFGDRAKLLAGLSDRWSRDYAQINYGPWDRLDNNRPFLTEIGPKPLGANFYPSDMTKTEFESHLKKFPKEAEDFRSLYTMIRRDSNGRLTAVPYHLFFEDPTRAAADRLRDAAKLAENDGLRRYLTQRASALMSDEYLRSDVAWMEMKSNTLDIVIGPIETYEDQMFGFKAAHEAYVLIKDQQWSDRLSQLASLLPELQKSLPVPAQYKRETPGSDSDLNAYDVIYYAGDCNAGSKTIAINLPNDEQIQLTKGTRRLQLKNAMRAKFDRIMVPIADELIVDQQRDHVTFDAFFGNTMFHEVAHGLGIKNTITGKGTVRDALRELASAIEEGKADILGLHIVTKLFDDQVLSDGQLMDNYVTFVGSIFRSIRFGASSAHGRANLLRFNFFAEKGAFTRTEDGHYRVHKEKLQAAMTELTARIIQLQGDGDYEGVKQLIEKYGQANDTLQADLDRLNAKGIPVDIVFEQGLPVLGL